MKNLQKESSVVYSYVEKIKDDYLMAPTVLIIVILIVALVVLKKFIYISDEKRDDK
jgi:hypothetical protein